jgi:dTDP-4-amino-4,6-dideoxygalactose transaminase
MIPLCDVHANYLSCKDEIDAAIERTIRNSAYILGEEVKAFEENFARYIGTQYCVGTSCATSALFMALMAIGVKKGDDVVVPVNTVTADVEAVKLIGANPIFRDVDDKYATLLHALPTKKTKAIIAVHMYGHPCMMDRLKQNGIPIIEDCSHAHGATYRDKKVGSIGDIGVFSFFPSKVLGGFGDGGCITTDNEEYAEKIRRLRDHGRTGKYSHAEWGFNFRLDGIQAAILNAKLPKLDEFIISRNLIAQRYKDEIKGIYTPPIADGCTHSWYVYAGRTSDRDFLRAKLAEEGIATGIHYYPILTQQPAYKMRKRFKNAEDIAKHTISLPMYPELKEQEFIIDVCNEVLNEKM